MHSRCDAAVAEVSKQALHVDVLRDRIGGDKVVTPLPKLSLSRSSARRRPPLLNCMTIRLRCKSVSLLLRRFSKGIRSRSLRCFGIGWLCPQWLIHCKPNKADWRFQRGRKLSFISFRAARAFFGIERALRGTADPTIRRQLVPLLWPRPHNGHRFRALRFRFG